MSPESPPQEWPAALSRCWLQTARVLASTSDEQEKPGRDSLGNPGRVRVVRHTGRLGLDWPRGRVVKALEDAGLRATRRTAEETELEGPRAGDVGSASDPFLLERSLLVTVHGRELPERQRAVIETKVAALRRELGDVGTPSERRDTAERMIEELESGLRTTVDVRAVLRRFRPTVTVAQPAESRGENVPIRAGTRIAYDVAPAKPEPGDGAEAEPMVFHVLAIGAREVVLLYSGGVHGTRHLRDLETSRVHHAWFANRERVKTDATAPWISRTVYRELAEQGRSDLVVHRRRDEGPIVVEKVDAASHSLRIDGKETEVPVLRCRTTRDDEMLVLADSENPLVLRLFESGADLVRTVVSVDHDDA
jgi:hypothetical protein